MSTDRLSEDQIKRGKEERERERAAVEERIDQLEGLIDARMKHVDDHTPLPLQALAEARELEGMDRVRALVMALAHIPETPDEKRERKLMEALERERDARIAAEWKAKEYGSMLSFAVGVVAYALFVVLLGQVGGYVRDYAYYIAAVPFLLGWAWKSRREIRDSIWFPW